MEFDPQYLAQAPHLVVFTGAGVSAESGIPTFRDALSGLWEHFDPAQLATPQAFRANPALVWGWYEWRRRKMLQAQPNPAHLAIAELARRVPRLTLITQNVDDLHERAGSPSVLHLHGSLHTPQCFACNRPFKGKLPCPDLPEQGGSLEPPRCSGCNGKIRPGVVWFGESLPQAILKAAFQAADDCDLLLSVGTSGLVQPAAQIPQRALQQGARVVHINPQPQECRAPQEYSLTGPAGQLLPQLVQRAFA
ncbi:NAD-dependent deacetylase [Pseudomonas saponiphila]|uniref:NAD-dependent protein deacylase n=1 Tax=Pseudomonas saponiphila TaxID=556534 RepID=A0A1H4Q0S2_9PSED|nr:NAD-dependent deacylase [Pseudomonas saponiphila]SEC13108.1 NAD-dependent deacetylase [Pseudomonas saponiphila]